MRVSEDSRSIPELRGLVARLAAEPAAWQHLVRHDAEQRVFERVLDEPDLEAWLICWMPGHDTGFHDHDLSSGAVTVVAGRGKEERLRPRGGGKPGRLSGGGGGGLSPRGNPPPQPPPPPPPPPPLPPPPPPRP